MAAAERLYTPELLALAVELAEWPPIETAALHGEARSPACGSTLAMDLVADNAGRIERLGMRVRACAVGQASATVFARRAPGLSEREIALALAKLEAWLDDQGPPPEWAGLHLIAPARDYPARHGAMLLPWKAALAALSSARAAG
jgi:NifU-like protein involved in Fe-S cluster formation